MVLPLPGSRAPSVSAYESLLRADCTEPQVPSFPWVPGLWELVHSRFLLPHSAPGRRLLRGSPPPPARLRPPRADLVAALVSTG